VTQVCIHPSCSPWQHEPFALSRRHLLGGTPPYKRQPSLCSRGPRSGSGYVVPDHRHLTGPIRPARGHIATSPHRGLYAMPSLYGSASATRERFRAFAAHSVLTCRPLRPRGVRHRSVPDSDVDIGLHRDLSGSALPKSPQSVSRGVSISGLPGLHICYGLPVCSPPCTDLTSFPATGDFYFQASNGSVTLPVAGYDYNSDWTPLLTGLSPVGTAASLAAPDLLT